MEADLCYQESLPLGREMGDKFSLALLHCYLGLLALTQGQQDQARAAFTEGLTISYQNDVKIYGIYNLIGMASLFHDQRKFLKAVVLLAASDRIAGSIGIKIEPELQEPYDRVIAGASQQLSEQDLRTAREIGERMDLEQAVKFALET